MMKKYEWILFSLLSFFILCNLFSWESEPALDLKFAPSDCVYVHRNACNSFTPGDHYDIILHTISIVNSSSESVRIDSVTIEAQRDGKLIQSRVLQGEEIARAAKSMWSFSKRTCGFCSTSYSGPIKSCLRASLWPQTSIANPARPCRFLILSFHFRHCRIL